MSASSSLQCSYTITMFLLTQVEHSVIIHVSRSLDNENIPPICFHTSIVHLNEFATNSPVIKFFFKNESNILTSTLDVCNVYSFFIYIDLSL